MILKDLFRKQLTQLSAIHPEERGKKILELMYESFLDIPQLLTQKHDNLPIVPSQQVKLEQGLQQLLQSMPVQYITQEAWFYGYKFKVSPAVLIPRPETEELVEQILRTNQKKEKKKIIDIGTGSGCIPVILKMKLPHAEITAVDIQADALQVAIENAAYFGTDINFLQLDFLKEDNWNRLGRYDIIVSNPPYISQKESADLDKTVVQYEPASALFVPDDSVLIFYEKIADFGKQHLTENGEIFAEINQVYAEEIQALFRQAGYNAHILPDMSGNPRMLEANRHR